MAPETSFPRELADILIRYNSRETSWDVAYLKICELNKRAFDRRINFFADPVSLLVRDLSLVD